jgi:tyrosine-protein kinase Etk/Wzc
MDNPEMPRPPSQSADADGREVGLIDILTWLGDGKLLISICTAVAIVLAATIAFMLPPVYSARTSLLPPGSQQPAGAAASLAALSSLGGLAGGLAGKTPDEFYVALLRSDSAVRMLDERFDLRQRYAVRNFESLRRALPKFVRITSDKKSGVILIEVDDEDPVFAASLANAHLEEATKVLARLAVSEAQQRRVFFEQQLKETKENLIRAETELRRVQESSGVIVLDKQAEALITGAAHARAQVAEREVRLKVLRTGATDQNPEVIRLVSELSALRAELSRMESSRGGVTGSTVDLPVGKIPEAAVDYVRARRELKLQETLLEAMVRQFELAKLDEAKEGPLLQQIDKAVPPDYKSKPARLLIVLYCAALALLASALWVLVRRYLHETRGQNLESRLAWRAARQAWRLRA